MNISESLYHSAAAWRWKKNALFSLSLWEGGRLNLSQSALDLSLSVDLPHFLSLSLSLPPSLPSPSRKRRKRPSRSQGCDSPKRSLGPPTIIECKTHDNGLPAKSYRVIALKPHFASEGKKLSLFTWPSGGPWCPSFTLNLATSPSPNSPVILPSSYRWMTCRGSESHPERDGRGVHRTTSLAPASQCIHFSLLCLQENWAHSL